MCMSVLSECVSGAHGVQKRTSDTLKLGLQMIVSHHVNAGNWTRIFCKSSRCVNCSVTSPTCPLASSHCIHRELQKTRPFLAHGIASVCVLETMGGNMWRMPLMTMHIQITVQGQTLSFLECHPHTRHHKVPYTYIHTYSFFGILLNLFSMVFLLHIKASTTLMGDHILSIFSGANQADLFSLPYIIKHEH